MVNSAGKPARYGMIIGIVSRCGSYLPTSFYFFLQVLSPVKKIPLLIV